MTIWIQSLSWTLIYSLGQGFLIYSLLWLFFKLVPGLSANSKYRISVSALTVVFVWFGITWWQQYALLLPITQASSNNLPATYPVVELLAVSTGMEYSGTFSFLPVIFPWLTTGYVLGLLFMLFRLSGGMGQLLSLKKDVLPHTSDAYDTLLLSLKNKLQLKGPVQLLLSAKAQVPMVVGFLKPAILMPVALLTQLSAAQLETILLHELAHIKRNDYLINIIQTVVETVLFFNPFTWMISGLIRRERELCCDDLVIELTREPIFYATALATVATHNISHSSFAMAATGQSPHLFNRIKRIMEMKKNSFSYSKMIAAIFLITTITCSLTLVAPSFADSKNNKPVAKEIGNLKPAEKEGAKDNPQEASLLIKQLIKDHMVNEVKGFVVEKRAQELYINGQLQSGMTARKYLSTIKQEALRIEVFSIEERLRRHPQSTFMQILAPIEFASPCVDIRSGQKAKEGC